MVDSLASIYHYIYLIIISILSIVIIPKSLALDGTVKQENLSERNCFALVLFIILFIGFRPDSGVFVDMWAYSRFFRLFNGWAEYSLETDNIIFDNLMLWWASKNLGSRGFFLLIAAIYFTCAYLGIRRLFPNHKYIAFLVFLAAFSTFSYGTNGIKAGAAASIFIMALGYRDKVIPCILLLAISYGFHHAMQVPIVAFLIVSVVKNPKYFFAFWILCFILACFHVTYFQELFGTWTDDQGAGYLLIDEEKTVAHIRFRPDFVLYSAMPVVIGYRLMNKPGFYLSKTYSFILRLYLLTNSIWMLCMYAAFNNRIAYLSWCIYPIVLIYPFFNDLDRNTIQYRTAYRTVAYHLCFTLFMVFVYYGIFHLGN